jgi:MFS family permease
MSQNLEDYPRGAPLSPGKPVTPRSSSLSPVGCALVLATAFLGWMCAGWQLAISSLAMHDAPEDLLQSQFVEQGIAKQTDVAQRPPSPATIAGFDEDGDGRLNGDEKGQAREAAIGGWFAVLTSAFLFGAAFGGYVFGWAGDRFGRAKAMALSILWYSVFSATTVLVQDPWQLLWARFITCMGIGGMWPNGIALVSEAWPNISRPILAGAIGTAANVGILMLNWIAADIREVSAADWHWIMWFGATPVCLGLFVLIAVPESPRWLALQTGEGRKETKAAGLGEVFRPPILSITLVGIALGTIPLFGGWGSSNWAMAWAAKAADATLKARLGVARSLTGTITSLLGGWLATLLGRRCCYFILSLGSLASSQILFWFYTPYDDEFWFLFWFGALGFFSGFYFGWLPLCLPELFPTRVRATGAGVSFNWGRIVTAVGVLFTGGMLMSFKGNYAAIGQLTSFIYALGLIAVFFIPKKSSDTLED